MLSGADDAGTVALAGDRALPVPAGQSRGRLLSVCPILVLSFLAEGVLNHLRPPFKLGFFPHMVLTASFLGAAGLYWVLLR
ncbi:MAG: hypothetical protein ACYS9X_09965, partial [Planctomycetota bacterium]